MDTKKDVMMFGNKKQILRTNALIKGGLCAITAGLAILVIGERIFYKTVYAIHGDDEPTSNIINDTYQIIDTEK